MIRYPPAPVKIPEVVLRCSTEGCRAQAALSWMRPATEAESAAHCAAARTVLHAHAEDARLALRLQIAALNDLQLPPSMHEADVRAIRRRAAEQAAELRVRHDAITDPEPVPAELVAVGACAEHAQEGGH